MTERQLVVHFEVMPQVSDEADLLCGDVRVLDSLVLSAEDGTAGFSDDVTTSTNVNLSLPVGINMSDLLNGTLEVVPQPMPNPPMISAEEAAQIQRGKIKIPALKRPPRKPAVSNSDTTGDSAQSRHHQNQHDCLPSKKASASSSGDDGSPSSLQFEMWLASITERINQTMHFGMPGAPDPLVCLIPHSFFDCLRDRISSGGRKKRLPNNTVGKTRFPEGKLTTKKSYFTGFYDYGSLPAQGSAPFRYSDQIHLAPEQRHARQANL